MDWDDDDLDDACLEAAIVQAEQNYQRRSGSGGGGGGGAPQQRPALPAASTEPSAVEPQLQAGACDAAQPQPETSAIAPARRRRKVPAVLLNEPPAAAAAGTGIYQGPVSAAVDENLPPACFTGTMHYAYTGVEVDMMCQSLLHSGVRALGFDIEWRVTYQTGVPPRPVALIQLCYNTAAAPAASGVGSSADGSISTVVGQRQQQGQQRQAQSQHCCLLLHIHHTGLTPHLKQLLCSEDILKVGVGAHGDALKMRRDFQLDMAGVICLSEFANARLVAPAAAPAAPACSDASAAGAAAVAAAAVAAVGQPAGWRGNTADASAGPAPLLPPQHPPPQPQQPLPQQQQQQLQLLAAPQKWSLAGLVSQLMRRRLEKSQAVRCSDWERPRLSEEQRRYAATDAWASLRVYEILSKLPVVAPPAPPLQPAGAAAPVGSAGPGAAAPALYAAAAAAQAAAGAAAGWVPACASLRHLQPAKLAVYQALVQQGLSVQQVAAQRHIQEDSVQGYMAEAMAAGYGYSWSSLGVPAAALEQVASVCSSLLGRPLCWQGAPDSRCGTSVEGAPVAQTAAAAAMPAVAAAQRGANGCSDNAHCQQGPGQPPPPQQQMQLQQQMGREVLAEGWRVGDKRPAPTSPGAAPTGDPASSHAAAAAAAAAGKSGGGGSGSDSGSSSGAAGGEPVDVLAQLLAAGHKLRELKEQHFADISYGQLRLALAHLGRCNLGPWE